MSRRTLKQWMPDPLIDKRLIYYYDDYSVLSIKQKSFSLDSGTAFECFVNDFYISFKSTEDEAKAFIEQFAKEYWNGILRT